MNFFVTIDHNILISFIINFFSDQNRKTFVFFLLFQDIQIFSQINLLGLLLL